MNTHLQKSAEPSAVYHATREIRMRVHEKCAYTRNTHGKMADCTHGRTTEGVLDLCNVAVSEKIPQIFDLRCPLST